MATTTTCTVLTSGVTGTRCGAPAVHVFTARTGATYGECAAHHVPVTAAAPTRPKAKGRTPRCPKCGHHHTYVCRTGASTKAEACGCEG